MSELKFFKIGFIIMVLLNLVLILLVMGSFHRPPTHFNGLHPFQHKIIKELKLDAVQTNEFISLSNNHHIQIETKTTQQKDNLQNYFSPLHGNKLTPPNHSLTIAIADIEREKIELTYEHLSDLKKLLNTQQEPYFSPILTEAVEIILGQTRKEKQ